MRRNTLPNLHHAGTFSFIALKNKPDEDPESGGGGSSTIETKEPETKEPEATKEETYTVMLDDGPRTFSKAEYDYLAHKGVASILAEQKKQTQPDSKDSGSSDSSEKEEPTLADLSRQIKDIEKQRRADVENQQRRERQEKLTGQLKKEIKSHEFAAEDPELQEFILDNALDRVARNPGKSIKDHVNDVVKVVTKGHAAASSKYAETKREDAEKTRTVKGSGEGGVSPAEEKKGFSAKDWMDGKLKDHTIERLRANNGKSPKFK